MKYRYKIFFLLLIIIFSCQLIQAKDNSSVDLDLLSRIYPVIKNQFIGDFEKDKSYNQALRNIEIFLEDNDVEVELGDFQITEDEDEDLDTFIARIDEIASEFTTDHIGREDIIREAIDGFLDALDDPYTFYMGPEEFIEFSDSLNKAEYTGVGIYLELDKKNEDKLTIIEAFDGNPAFQAGIRAGDIIVKNR